MNSSLFIIGILFLLLVLFVVAFVYIMMRQKHAKDAEDSIFLTSKKVKFDKWYSFYATLESVGITKNFVRNIYRQYEILDPGNEKEVKEKTVKLSFLVWGVSAAIIFAIIIILPSFFGILCGIYAVYNLSHIIISSNLQKLSLKLEQDFSKFMSEVRHNFFKHGMVDEAIYETFDKISHLMQGHALLIYKILTADDVDEAINKYSVSAPNQYMKQFVSICAITMKYGDKTVNGQSLFLTDIKDLKQTMDADLLKKAQVKNKFSALDIIAIVPVFSLDFIKNWGIDIVPGLQKFYDGRSGLLLVIGVFVCSFVVNWFVCRLRDGKQVDRSEHPFLDALLTFRPVKRFVHNYEEANFTKTYKMKVLLKGTGSSYTTQTLLLKRLFLGLIGFVAALIIIVFLNLTQIDISLNDVREVADKGTGTTDVQNVAAMVLTKVYLDEYYDKGMLNLYNQEVNTGDSIRQLDDTAKTKLVEYLSDKFSTTTLNVADETIISVIQSYNTNHSASTGLYTVAYGTGGKYTLPEDSLTLRKIDRDFNKIKVAVNEENGLKQLYLYGVVAQAVIDHSLEYEGSTFRWYFIFIAILVSILFYNLPVIILKIDEKELQDFMEDEVVQFQSIIMILMYIDRMTVGTILEELVKFAFCFRDSIQTCINNVPSGEEEALTTLMEVETFEPFQRVVENLISCDRIGVLQAFNEIDAERQNYIEKRKQESEIRLSKISSIATLVAYAPLYFVIVGYMVIPFMVEAMSSLSASISSVVA